jgi:hypothetical protein
VNKEEFLDFVNQGITVVDFFANQVNKLMYHGHNIKLEEK